MTTMPIRGAPPAFRPMPERAPASAAATAPQAATAATADHSAKTPQEDWMLQPAAAAPTAAAPVAESAAARVYVSATGTFVSDTAANTTVTVPPTQEIEEAPTDAGEWTRAVSDAVTGASVPLPAEGGPLQSWVVAMGGAAPAPGAAAVCCVEGYLQKCALGKSLFSFGGGWKRRFFQVRAAVVAGAYELHVAYSEAPGTKTLGTVLLNASASVRIVEAPDTTVHKEAKQPLVDFAIIYRVLSPGVDAQRDWTLLLRAESAEEKARWVNFFKMCLKL
jgi:hypothetical protein